MNTQNSLSMLIMQKLNENDGEFTLADITDIAIQNAEYVVSHCFARFEGRVMEHLQYAIQKRNQVADAKDQSSYDYYNGAVEALNAVMDDIGEIRRS